MLRQLLLALPAVAAGIGGIFKDATHYKSDDSLAGLRFIAESPPGTLTVIGTDDGTNFWKQVGTVSDIEFAAGLDPKRGLVAFGLVDFDQPARNCSDYQGANMTRCNCDYSKYSSAVEDERITCGDGGETVPDLVWTRIAPMIPMLPAIRQSIESNPYGQFIAAALTLGSRR